MNDNFKQRATELREIMIKASLDLGVYISVTPNFKGFVYIDTKTGESVMVKGEETTLGKIME